MANHNIGKIFVSLDLDASRYMKGQQTLLKEAQHGATILEKNFRNLGTKSSATFDLMRARAVKAFETIKKSGRATTDDLIRAEKAKAEKIKRINDQQYGHTTSIFDKIKKHWMATTAAIIAAWYAVGGAIRKGSEVVLAAARYETLGVSMRVVGNNAGYTYQELTELQGELEKTGISMRGSRQSIIKMAQAQLDLSKATELARGAQHAAVIGAMDSTEAFNQMVYGIQSANVRVLRTIGINVSFEESYKKLETQLGRSKETFTQAEKAGARLSVTLEALTRLSGTYEAAMETAGKQLLSLNRHFDNLKVKAGAAFTPALLEAVQTITGDIKDLNKELSGESTQKIHEWGVGFRLTIIDIRIELMNVALLLDKIGGTMTTVMVGLFSFGNAIGNENSQKQYTEWMKKNLEYEKRYWQTVINIVELEEKQLALEYSLTDAGKAQAKAKLEALENVRLAASAAAKALEDQRVAEERTAEAATKHAKELDKEIKKANKELEAYYKNLEKTKENLNKFFRVELIADPVMKSVEQLKIKFEELEKQIYETFAGKELKAQLANLSKWYGMEYEEIVKTTEETTEEVDELWTNALDRVQSTLADTFMDAMKGELDSFEDVFKSFCDVILRYWAEMAAKMTMYDIFGVGRGSGGSGWGSFLGGIFGGGGGSGSTGQTAAQAAMMAGHGPVSEEWALAQGFRSTAQGAGAAWSFKGIYGAYNAAGGGWAGMQAGAGSLGGGIGAGISGISWTGWAAIAYFASELLSGLNVKKGYGQLTYAPRGYGYGGEFQPTSPFQGDFGTDPLGTYIRGVLGIDDTPMAGNYFSAAIKESDWWEAMKALPATILEWSSPFVTMGLSALGLDMGKIFGFGNKKRSYYGKEFTYGDYSLEEGWGTPVGEVYKDKRKGEKAFGESGESMAQTGQDLMNALDNLFKSLLGHFGEEWENLFTTQMIDLAEAGLSFDFYISAEDKGEFKDDWRKSWADLAKNLIDPIIDIGSDLLSQALDGAVTDAIAWDYFTDDMREYLKTSLEDSLADLKVDWSTITNQEDFEAALEQMGMAAENIQAIMDYFTQIGDILDQVSDAISLNAFSGPAQAAIQSLRDINAQFDEFSIILDSLGVDLEKYTDLEIARNIAIANEVRAMSDAAISGEDLALALKYMREEMEEAGHTAEDVAYAMSAAISGVLDSIEDIKKQYADYGKTARDLLIEKYPEWEGIDFEQWLQMSENLEDLTEFSTEMLQDWRNLGESLLEQWKEQQESLDDNTDALENFIQQQQIQLKELEQLVIAFDAATDAITDYQEKLLSGAGILPPDVQYAQASSQLTNAVQDLYSKDRETALAATQAIPDYVRHFLEASKAFAATPEQYMADFARAMMILNTAAEISANWASKISSQVASYGFSDEGGGDYGGSTPSYDPSLQWGDPGYYYPMQQGGIISGPETGYQAPITFHGTEHIVSGNQMGDVKEILGEVKEVLIQVRDTNGDQNKTSKKLYRIIDRVSQGEEYLMTKAV